jgi:hypothetical protein
VRVVRVRQDSTKRLRQLLPLRCQEASLVAGFGS